MKNYGKNKFALLASGAVLVGAALVLNSFTVPQDATKWVAPATAEKTVNPIASDAASIAAGKVLFTKNCEQCHGKKGRGDGPKSAELEKQVGDMTTADFAAQSDGAIFWKMTQGRKPMPSFKKEMSDDQRWQVINYIRGFAKPKAKK
jgi:mono/diheme cytochrome c family protein